MYNLTIIAAKGKNNELGLNNELIWHLPKDLNFFKENTIDKYILMGKNTLDSLPRVLSNRKYLVLTHKEIEKPYIIRTFKSIEEVLAFLSEIREEVMVIGGASVYKQVLPYTNKMLLTEIEASSMADSFFPNINLSEWNKDLIDQEEENNIKYKHYCYTRK